MKKQEKSPLVQLTLEEQDVYFSSQWYKNLMKKKRHDLIAKGFIKKTGYHKNNPR